MKQRKELLAENPLHGVEHVADTVNGVGCVVGKLVPDGPVVGPGGEDGGVGGEGSHLAKGGLG